MRPGQCEQLGRDEFMPPQTLQSRIDVTEGDASEGAGREGVGLNADVEWEKFNVNIHGPCVV